jgi:hypothetical protein
MTFLETINSNSGELIQLKDQLFWLGGRGWDNNPGRVCLILDVRNSVWSGGEYVVSATTKNCDDISKLITILLLIDGVPKWVIVNEQDVEVIVGDKTQIKKFRL